MIAGSDTTATTIANVFFLLLQHEEKYKRLQEEVDKYYPPGEDTLDPKHYVDMHYLDAVMYVQLLYSRTRLTRACHTVTRRCVFSPPSPVAASEVRPKAAVDA